jgi:transposase-like protein
MSMDAPKQARVLNRNRSADVSPSQRGDRQIVIPMTREEFDENWRDSGKMRKIIDRMMKETPELFPACLLNGYGFHGMARTSKKLDGIQLRKIRAAGGTEAYHLRPSFVMSFMTGATEDVEYPLLLASFGVPGWVLTLGFGHNDMYWHRLVERIGRNSLVGTTVRDPARLPKHLAADEHHVDWNGEKGYVATTAAEGCILGVGLTKAADDEHLTAAYGDFAAETREMNPEYAPETVNTDGWSATQNAFKACFSRIVVILCFLHGFLKIRDRSRKNHELHRRVWEVYWAKTAAEFRSRMEAFRTWFESQTWTTSVREMAAKLWKRSDEYEVAYAHPGCRRTSNAVDRPMNRMHRLVYAGRGLHGHQANSQRRLRGWALLLNFRPFANRSGQVREHQSSAHRLNGKRYSDSWLQNLQVSASLMGRRQPAPAIR